jgi:RNA polymerase sigma-70 factor (ECF subfamily)
MVEQVHMQLDDDPDGPGREAERRLRTLIERYGDALYRTALRLTGHREEAEDLVQEALMRAWRARATFRPEGNGRAWLFTIMMNARAEAFRRARTAPAAAPVGEIDDLPGRSPEEYVPLHAQDPENTVLSGFLSEDIQAVLHQVPEQFLAAFVLADLEHFSYQEIHGILGVPLGTVRSRIARARRLLQQGLWAYCVRTGECRGPAPAVATSTWLPDCIEACRHIVSFLDHALDAAVLAQVQVAPCWQCCDRPALQRRLGETIRR